MKKYIAYYTEIRNSSVDFLAQSKEDAEKIAHKLLEEGEVEFFLGERTFDYVEEDD